LFSIVERPNNYAFGDKMTPSPRTGLGERSLNYKIIHCLRIIFLIGKYSYISQMGGDEFSGGGFSKGKIFHGKRSFRRVIFPGEILQWGNLPEFLYEFPFISFTLFVPTQFDMWRY